MVGLLRNELFEASAPFILKDVVVVKIKFLQQVIEGLDLGLGEVSEDDFCDQVHSR